MSFKYAIVLTGGIATGKSTASKYLSNFGFSIIDADEIAHQVLDENAKKIAEMFGDNLLQNTKINRKSLGEIVFSDDAKRKALEEILHPLIYEKIEYLSSKLDKKQKFYLIDIPLFFEGWRYCIDKSIVVYTAKEIQVERLMGRDGYSKEEALRRIDSQMDIEEKRKRATYVIDNSSSLEQLKHECTRIKKEVELSESD